MELIELQDSHKGKPAFILGAGPSLHFQNIDLLKDSITFSVNSSIVKADFSTYFLTDDVDVSNWSYYSINLPKIKSKCLFYHNKLKNSVSHLDQNRIYWYKHYEWKDGIKSLNFLKSNFLVGARTSVGSAVHAAHIMGCDPIILLGCDCCLLEGKRYFWEFENEAKPYRTDRKNINTNSRLKPSKKDKKLQLDSHSEDFMDYWSKFSIKSKESGLNIINASGGILECFEKRSYEDVINKYTNNKC